MLNIFLNILPVFAIILAGYGGARFNVIPSSAHQALNQFVACFALPAMLFHIIATTDWETMWDMNFVIASLLGSGIVFAAGALVGRLRGLPVTDMAIDSLNASFANATYMGLPLFLLAIGAQSMPYVIIGGTVTLTILLISSVLMIEWSQHHHLGAGHALGKALIGVIRNPIITCSLLGVLWWMTGWKLPDAIGRSTQILGMAASPTALFSIGLFLAERPLIESVANRFVLGLSAIKLILHPAITAIIAWPILGMGQFTGTVVVMMAALPTGTGPFMISAFYARDNKVTSGTILVSTLVSAISISAILSLLPH